MATFAVFTAGAQSAKSCGKSCGKKKADTKFACKLTSTELQQRKATVLADLKKTMLEKKELPDGFAYKFDASDATIDRLNSFVKDEKECCDFLTLNVKVDKEKKESWLEISGPDGVKDFITKELEM